MRLQEAAGGGAMPLLRRILPNHGGIFAREVHHLLVALIVLEQGRFETAFEPAG